jgi:hypothetical protein
LVGSLAGWLSGVRDVSHAIRQHDSTQPNGEDEVEAPMNGGGFCSGLTINEQKKKKPVRFQRIPNAPSVLPPILEQHEEGGRKQAGVARGSNC